MPRGLPVSIDTQVNTQERAGETVEVCHSVIYFIGFIQRQTKGQRTLRGVLANDKCKES